MKDLHEFEQIIGYSFRDKTLLKTAMTHSSYANENRNGKIPYNERLEFLGDSVLGLVISRYIFENYPDFPEGKLTKMRASVVCERSLWACASALHFGDYIILGRGEEHMGGRTRMSILSDAFEAVIAAIYLDSDLQTVRQWILQNLQSTVTEAAGGRLFTDYKTEFQEAAQIHGDVNITYEVVRESGPDHNKLFVVDVYLNGKKMGCGEGASKKKAEQQAAQNALILLMQQAK